MQKHKLLVIPLLAIIAISGFLAGQQLSTTPSNSLENAMHVELYIYKNGKLIYYDPDDPAVVGLLSVLAEVIASDVAPAIVADGGATFSKFATGDPDVPGYVFLSEANITFDRNMTNLPANRIDVPISGAQIVNLDTLSLTATWTANTTVTIYGVGIYAGLDEYDAATTLLQRNVVLFYDPLAQPITLNPNDVITITYKIIAP